MKKRMIHWQFLSIITSVFVLAIQTDETTKSTSAQNERRDGSSNVLSNPPSTMAASSRKTRPSSRNFPFLTSNNNAPTPITRR